MKKLLTSICICFLPILLLSQEIKTPLVSIDPDDAEAAKEALESARNNVRIRGVAAHTMFGEMLDLGMWVEAGEIVDQVNDPLQLMKWHYLNNDFAAMELVLRQMPKRSPAYGAHMLFEARLLIQSWELEKALVVCERLMRANPKNLESAILKGDILVLQKKYEEALELAQLIQTKNPTYSAAYRLEADVYFWQQDPKAAEKPLRKCLELNPFDADARFWYGYAIWRRVDASQLKDMAAQWELALEINPLHYLTHWHWGNGHTHLTYSDYVDEEEDEIRKQLKQAELSLANENIEQALKEVELVKKAYPKSVIPDLYKGSFLYLANLLPNHLDQAQEVFASILEQKPHYGPAHNGIAAVIKAKRIPFLADFDSLNQVIAKTDIPNMDLFTSVFPDMQNYPGQRVPKMVYAQLYASKAYLPMLKKLNRIFVIPPLHIDLALAMENSFFRSSTTFDNRQWMDIRGVGSGATGIEYVLRGAFQERNVTLHEYVHLFHGTLFTDDQLREIRKRYNYAMENDLTLDYYSANNEFEYFAQTYPAYFIPVKVHPLNHKSVNMRKELIRKDPKMYDFIDQLVKKQEAYLEGDEQAMADTWAKTYLTLAKNSHVSLANAFLDTALQWKPDYLEAHLQKAVLHARENQFDLAEKWIEKSISLRPDHPSIFTTQGDMVQTMEFKGEVSVQESLEKRIQLYKKAIGVEDDLRNKARLAERLGALYWSNNQYKEAIESVENYANETPGISTYLRDQKDNMAARGHIYSYAWRQGSEAIQFFEDLSRRKPQNFSFQLDYAYLLIDQGKHQEAIDLLKNVRKLLAASGSRSRVGNRIPLLLAWAYVKEGNRNEAVNWYKQAARNKTSLIQRPFLLSELALLLNKKRQAKSLMAELDRILANTPYYQAEHNLMQAKYWQAKKRPARAKRFMDAARAGNKYLSEISAG